MELIDILVMSVAMGFIFRDVFKKPKSYNYDPLLALRKKFNWQDFWFAMSITAPAVILHEFGHKFVAMAFGAHAVFNAAYTWLAIGVALKFAGAPFVFFVPAYVSISPVLPWQHALIGFAGPAVNLILFGISWWLLKNKKFSRTLTIGLVLTKRINLLLFAFNMLPIPGFDGFHVVSGIWQAIF